MLTRWTWEHMSNVFFVSFRRPRYGQQISVESKCSTNMRPTPPHLVQKLLPLLVEYLIKYLSSYLMLIVYW